jgi:hypothetical protein
MEKDIIEGNQELSAAEAAQLHIGTHRGELANSINSVFFRSSPSLRHIF